MTQFNAMAVVLSLILSQGIAHAVSYERPAIPLPEPRGYVSDHAEAIDGDWKERIRSVCQDLERKTGIEMVVVTVPSIKPFRSANEYATAIYEKWGIGSTQQEHGMLVLVAVRTPRGALLGVTVVLAGLPVYEILRRRLTSVTAAGATAEAAID